MEYCNPGSPESPNRKEKGRIICAKVINALTPFHGLKAVAIQYACSFPPSHTCPHLLRSPKPLDRNEIPFNARRRPLVAEAIKCE